MSMRLAATWASTVAASAAPNVWTWVKVCQPSELRYISTLAVTYG